METLSENDDEGVARWVRYQAIATGHTAAEVLAVMETSEKTRARLSELLSEKPRKRGRPKAWHEPASFFDGAFGPRTERGKQNHRLAMIAYFRLRWQWDPSFAWFWGLPPSSLEECERREGRDSLRRDLRWTVLAELGRIQDPMAMFELAHELASLPLESTLRDVVASMREVRTGRRTTTPHRLANKLARSVADHMQLTRMSLEEAIAVVGAVRRHLVDIQEQEDEESETRERLRVESDPIRVEEPEPLADEIEAPESLRMRVQ